MGNWITGDLDCPYCGKINGFDLLSSNDYVIICCIECGEAIRIEQKIVVSKNIRRTIYRNQPESEDTDDDYDDD